MDKSFFKKCWEDKRWHSLMVLLIWIIVLAVLMGILYIANSFNSNSISNEKNDTNSEVDSSENTDSHPEVLSYFEKLENLLSQDYEYVYSIKNKEQLIKYEGTKKDGITIGYKQDALGIIKYKIENQRTYQILVNDIIDISNLYDEIDASLLDLNYIIPILNQVNTNDIIITEEENLTTYNYNLTQDEEEMEIVVTENESQVETIEIKRNNETYLLQYKLI